MQLPRVSTLHGGSQLRREAYWPQVDQITVHRRSPDNLPGVIPEIDIWRVANLMLKRYGDEADIESAIRAEELAAAGDWVGEAAGAGLLTLSGS